MKSITENRDLLISTTTVTGTGIVVNNDLVVANQNGASCAIVPVAPLPKQTFVEYTPKIVFAPSPHKVYSGSTTTQLNISDSLGSILANGNYTEIEANLNNSVVSVPFNASMLQYGEHTTSLDSFIELSSVLPVPLVLATFLLIQNTWYCFGGYDGKQGVNTIYSATIGASGTLSNWTLSTETLPFAGWSLPMAVIGSFVYLFGGWNESSSSDVVYVASISGTGVVGAFASANNPLPVGICATEPYVNADYVYLFGGKVPNSGSNAIYSAPITNNVPGAWTLSTATLPVDMENVSWAIVGSTLFLVGASPLGVGLTSLYAGAINTDGTVGAIAASGPTIPYISSTPKILSSGFYIYIVGGNDNSNIGYNIYQITYMNGVYSGFTYDVTTTITTTGSNGSTSTSVSASYSSWTTINTGFPPFLFGASVKINNGYVYIFGGTNGSKYYSSVYLAPIQQNVSNVTINLSNALAAVPSQLFLTQNFSAQGLIGNTANGDVLSNLQLVSSSFNVGLFTYTYNTLANKNPGNLIYENVSGLNVGDSIVYMGGIITGKIRIF
jgi:hypothetical protein